MGQPVISIRGEKVALGPLRSDLVPLYHRWMNDFEIQRAYRVPKPISRLQVEQWYERASASDEHMRFIIYDAASLRPIGKAGLYHIDFRNRRAEFGILIGEPDAHGKGYGTEATRLVLGFGFTTLGLHSVLLEVSSCNLAGIRACEKAGFKETGRRRESFLYEGSWHDKIYMDVLESEFVGPEFDKIPIVE